MPTVTTYETLNMRTVDILNAIRNSATANYRNYVPTAYNTDDIKAIGAVIMDYPALQNEFLNALINRVGRVILTNKMYKNPWSMFKKGLLEYGETIEEIFVDLAKPFKYDPAVAENKVFAREIPDVRAAFHILNYQKFYKATIQDRDLRQAFLTANGITDMIAKIVDSMYSASNYDEFLVMKYLLARHILNGVLYPTQISAVSAANMKGIASTVKAVSNNLEFMSNKYNLAGVQNYSLKNSQYLITTAEFDAVMDVEVLASAFHMEKAEFMGHRVMIDGFGNLDTERLGELFAGDDSYTALTSDELTALSAIPAVIVDKDFFMIYDKLFEFTEQYNGQGLYWNYFYHCWKVFSVSPFANAIVFVPGAPDVTRVTVSPAAATVMPGQTLLLSATVATTNMASKSVDWSLTISGEPADPEDAQIDIYGNVDISPDIDPGTVITAKATSRAKPTVYGTATLTVYEESTGD